MNETFNSDPFKTLLPTHRGAALLGLQVYGLTLRLVREQIGETLRAIDAASNSDFHNEEAETVPQTNTVERELPKMITQATEETPLKRSVAKRDGSKQSAAMKAFWANMTQRQRTIHKNKMRAGRGRTA